MLRSTRWLVQRLGSALLAFTIIVPLIQATPLLVDCINKAEPKPEGCCSSKKLPTAESKGCCCEVSSLEGHPATTATQGLSPLVVFDIIAVLSTFPVEQPGKWQGQEPILGRSERPPPQISTLRQAPKRAPPDC